MATDNTREPFISQRKLLRMNVVLSSYIERLPSIDHLKWNSQILHSSWLLTTVVSQVPRFGTRKLHSGKTFPSKFLSKAAKLPGNITNHSVRKACVSRLMDADIPENFVAQLSGHKNLESLDSYKSASTAHQRKMLLVLSRSTPPSCVTGSKRLQPLETNQTNEAFNHNV